MLWRILVAKLHALVERVDLDDQTLGDGLLDDVHTWESVGLAVHLDFDVLQELVRERDGDEDDLRIDAVLGLGKKVGRDKHGVGRFVGNDLRQTD